MVWNQHSSSAARRWCEAAVSRLAARRFRPADETPDVIRGGTVTLRDPATLALLSTPFDPFGAYRRSQIPAQRSIRYNLPNLAIFLWRLAAYRIRVSKPIQVDDINTGPRPS